MAILSEMYMNGGLSKSCEGHDSCKFPTKLSHILAPAKKSRAVTPPSYIVPGWAPPTQDEDWQETGEFPAPPIIPRISYGSYLKF